MDFELAEEHKHVQEMMRDFANNEIIPVGKTLEEQHEFPKDLVSKLAGLGILGMTIPVEFGGIQTDELSFIIALEEIGRALASLSVIVSVHCSLFCYAINTFGSPSQKEKYLPQAATGQTLGAFSLTEPGAGSDATQLKTKAIKDGNVYVLNGTKTWVTNGREANALILFAKTKKDKEKKVSAFIVDKDTPGLRVTRIEEKLGLHASPTAELSLEDCSIPAENLLGKEGQGTAIAFQCLDHSRIGIAAQSVGLAQRALDEAVKYAKRREAFGTTLSSLQAVQFMISDIATQTEAARLLTYQATLLFENGKSFGKEASMAKLFASEAANKIAYLALQIHGGYGYSKEYIVEQLFRDARAFTLYEGTSEIQRLVISRYLLKE